MKLWILRQVKGSGYDQVLGVVIRAESGTRARELAATKAQDEGAKIWRDPGTSCEELDSFGGEEIVIQDCVNG